MRALAAVALTALGGCGLPAPSAGGRGPDVVKIASDPSTSPEALAQLYIDRISHEGWMPHLDPSGPREEAMSSTPSGYTFPGPLFGALAANPKTPPDVLYNLVSEGGEIATRALGNPAMQTPEAKAKVAETTEHLKAASDPATPPSQLAELAADIVNRVRAKVAANPTTAPEVLLKLSADGAPDVRTAAAGNPSTTPEALGNLAGDAIEPVRRKAGRNEKTPPDALVFLAPDNSSDVRAAVACNPSTPVSTLTILSGDHTSGSNLYIRGCVGINPSAPAAMRTAVKVWEDWYKNGHGTPEPSTPGAAGRDNIGSAGTQRSGSPAQQQGTNVSTWKAAPPKKCQTVQTSKDGRTGNATWAVQCN